MNKRFFEIQFFNENEELIDFSESRVVFATTEDFWRFSHLPRGLQYYIDQYIDRFFGYSEIEWVSAELIVLHSDTNADLIFDSLYELDDYLKAMLKTI